MFVLGMLSIATYCLNHGTLINLRKERLEIIAELRAAQLQQAMGTLLGQVVMLASKSSVEAVLNKAAANNGTVAEDDPDLRQLQVGVEYSDNIETAVFYNLNLQEVVKITNVTRPDNITTPVFPQSFYPLNSTSMVLPVTLDVTGGYLYGPEMVDGHRYVSITRALTQALPSPPKINSTEVSVHSTGAIGYITAVLRARPIVKAIVNSTESQNDVQSRITLVQLASSLTDVSNDDSPHRQDSFYEYVLSGMPLPDPNANYSCAGCICDVFITGNATSQISAQSLGNMTQLSMGCAPVQILDRDFAVVVYQEKSVVYKPLQKLVNMILISIFAIGAGMGIVTVFLARWIVNPISRLQEAVEAANPFLATNKPNVIGWTVLSKFWKHDSEDGRTPSRGERVYAKLAEISTRMSHVIPGYLSAGKPAEGGDFKIPDRIVINRVISDELTQLTEMFNEMTDELRRQYQKLEERVAERTHEIESARVSAENANEAKSVFIANITHELRTPLNGVLGMASVAMESDDPDEIKSSLRVIFKSGELLLHLLTELLTFSKTNLTENDNLDEKELLVTEIQSQLQAIFEQQSKDKAIKLNVTVDSPALKDTVLYGDINRILQIVINLISNSLKFTPKGGEINCRISGSLFPRLKAETSSASSELVESSGETAVEGDSTMTKASMSTFSESNDHGDEETRHDEYFSDDEKNSKSPDDTEASSESKDAVSLDSRGMPKDYADYAVMVVRFAVQDTGPGIAPHLQARIFEPFVQGDLQFSERKFGAGLGLSICKRLAKLMFGFVTMESELGKGSTFTFEVPLRVIREVNRHMFPHGGSLDDWPEYDTLTVENASSGSRPTTPGEIHPNDSAFIAAAAAAAAAIANGDTASNSLSAKRPPISRNPSSLGDDRKIKFPARVLVAEDNKVNQEVMVRMLKLEGLSDVTISNDGQEAFNAVKASIEEGKPFDIIFMDVQMPNVDGLEATQKIRRELNYRGPVVGVSAFADDSNRQKCYINGMTRFLPKPLRRPDLRQLLFQVLVEKDLLFYSPDEPLAEHIRPQTPQPVHDTDDEHHADDEGSPKQETSSVVDHEFGAQQAATNHQD